MKEPGQVTRTPASLRWAVWVLAVQAVALAGVTGLFVYDDVTARPGSLRDALATTAYFAVLTLVFAVLAWYLRQRRSWARGPAIVLELLCLPVGYLMVQAGQLWLGVPVILLGLLGAGLLLAPTSREALGIR
ncbi:MAG TPA: hypothetical protein VF054_17875 [Micromonosporaceae bacterium]